ncbi:hypothetical protein UCRNP2_3563 [Neofusicoccum parvum UCRNP2]|uniref:Uncharacterized protein n=1 Tax=Botryosphaeria parva (strain UCR-NP2) TaxID=1287680 RepID=R1GDL6_BOTPV|nr:hypothetical protein UCRNP2_3563 [Neofusicoccum parvum UCRNP2]
MRNPDLAAHFHTAVVEEFELDFEDEDENEDEDEDEDQNEDEDDDQNEDEDEDEDHVPRARDAVVENMERDTELD